MRAGKLDRELVIERVTTTIGEAGTPLEAWSTLVTLRAELLEDKITEELRDQGASTERLLTFRTRFFPGLTVADRLTFEAQAFDLVAVKEVGRRRELELQAKRVGP